MISIVALATYAIQLVTSVQLTFSSTDSWRLHQTQRVVDSIKGKLI